MDYTRITEGFIRMCDCIIASETDETTWWLGECDYATLDTLIVGAYWHYSEWHAGQNSLEYAALSALGRIFSPGMGGPEDDNDIYIALGETAIHYDR
jgi:hypothetical protein